MTYKTILAAAVGSVLAVSVAQANQGASFILENGSGQPIDTIQVSPASSAYWSQDLLGTEDVLPTGRSVRVDPGSRGCHFDVRVIYRNDAAETFWNVNLCNTYRIRFANSRDYVVD